MVQHGWQSPPKKGVNDITGAVGEQTQVMGGGGHVETREFKSRDEIVSLSEPAVFNCSGLGSRALANDDALIPMKGQLTLLRPQPEITYMLAVPKQRLYMMPRSDGIVLGTSLVRGNWSLEPDTAEIQRVLIGVTRLRV